MDAVYNFQKTVGRTSAKISNVTKYWTLGICVAIGVVAVLFGLFPETFGLETIDPKTKEPTEAHRNWTAALIGIFFIVGGVASFFVQGMINDAVLNNDHVAVARGTVAEIGLVRQLVQ